MKCGCITLKDDNIMPAKKFLYSSKIVSIILYTCNNITNYYINIRIVMLLYVFVGIKSVVSI